MPADVRLIAFYLPQFHPIPENDEWWGAGFTEWTNVTRARPMYKGHYQPRRPGELGYYDLRVKDVRHRQIDLARKYGIHGFCYYYYWFSGRRLLEQPLDLMLADAENDFPFCVCWANENWTRRWDGSEHEILIHQKHLPDDPRRFIEDLAPVLRDRRYITVDGAPLLLIYRPATIPRLSEVLRICRQTAEQSGFPRLHVCAVQSFGYTSGLEDGFDAMVEFPPHGSVGAGDVTGKMLGVVPRFKGKIYSYPEVVRYHLRRGPDEGIPLYRGLMPAWDNTARSGYASTIFHNATPNHYEVWLRRLLDHTRRHLDGDHRLIFLNAWNEWAEGAYMEPDERFQYRYLEATARAVFGVPQLKSLVSTLRQINAGNEEAQRVLDQLEQAVTINQSIVNLIDAKGYVTTREGSDGFTGAFRAVEESSIRVPEHLLPNCIGRLDALGRQDYGAEVTLDRAQNVLVQGWIATQDIQAHLDSPVVFELTNVASGKRYVARVSSRLRRDDVARHLRDSEAFKDMPEACSLYSGYRAYLNIAAVDSGQYTLQAIVPAPDGHGGAVCALHPSIQVV